MAKPNLSDWLTGAIQPDDKRNSRQGPYTNWQYLLSTLRSGAPGQWSQNLLELSRHFTSGIFVAINTMAKQAAGSRLECWEKTDDPQHPGGKQQLPDYDPIVELWQDPNPQDTWNDHIYQQVQQGGLTGVRMTWVIPTESGDVHEMYTIPSCTAWPMPPTPEMPFGSYRVMPYPYGQFGVPAVWTAVGALVPAPQIVRIKNHHPVLRYDGYATLTAISLQADVIEAIDKGRYSAQRQGCDQTLALELDGETLAPDTATIDALRTQLQAIYAGPDNVGKLLIPPTGGKFASVSTSPKDMAYQEGWMQLLDFALAAYGVPTAVAGMQQQMSYATLYSSYRAFAFLSLGPELLQCSEGWNKKINRPKFGKRFGMTIFPPELKDEALVEQQIANDQRAGIRLNREVRRMRGLDHLGEPWENERSVAIGGPAKGGSDREPATNAREDDPDVDNARPNKTVGGLPENLFDVLEKAKTNGHALPINPNGRHVFQTR